MAAPKAAMIPGLPVNACTPQSTMVLNSVDLPKAASLQGTPPYSQTANGVALLLAQSAGLPSAATTKLANKGKAISGVPDYPPAVAAMGAQMGSGQSSTAASRHLAAQSTSPTYFLSSLPAAPSATTHVTSSVPKCTSPTHFTPAAVQSATSAHFTSLAARLTSPTNFMNTLPTTTQSSSPTHLVISAQAAAPDTSPTHPTSTAANSCSVETPHNITSDSSTDVLSPLPDGLEHRVVSGLLLAGPPMTLNTLQGAGPQKSEAAAVSSSGHKVVATGSVASVSNRPSTAPEVGSAQKSRRRNSSDSNPLPSSVSSTPAVTSSSKPRPKPLHTKAPLKSSPSTTMGSALPISPSIKSTPVLPSRTMCKAAASMKQPQPLLSSNNYSLELSLSSMTPLESLAAVNGSNLNGLGNVSSPQCGGCLITSPSDLLSPPGSTTLPDLLKTFVFPASLSPPVERKTFPVSKDTPSLQSAASAQQNRPSQLYLLGQFSLKSPESSSNGREEASRNSPLLSPNQQRRNSPVLQRGSPLLSPDHPRSSCSTLSSKQRRMSPAVIPTSQKNGLRSPPPDLKRSNGPIVSPLPNKSSFSFPSPDHQRSTNVLSSNHQNGAAPKSQRNGTESSDYHMSVKTNSQGKSSTLSGDGNRQTGPVVSLGLQRSSSNMPPLNHPKSSAVTSSRSQSSFWTPVSTHQMTPQTKSAVPSSNMLVNSTMLPSGCQGNNTVISHTSQWNNTVPMSDSQRKGAVVVSPNSLGDIPLPSFEFRRNDPTLSSDQHGSAPLPSPDLHAAGSGFSLDNLFLPSASQQTSSAVSRPQGKSTELSFNDLGKNAVSTSVCQRSGNLTSPDHQGHNVIAPSSSNLRTTSTGFSSDPQNSRAVPSSGLHTSNTVTSQACHGRSRLPSSNGFGSSSTGLPPYQQRTGTVIAHTSKRRKSTLQQSESPTTSTVFSPDHRKSSTNPPYNQHTTTSPSSFPALPSSHQRSSTALSSAVQPSRDQKKGAGISPTWQGISTFPSPTGFRNSNTFPPVCHATNPFTSSDHHRNSPGGGANAHMMTTVSSSNSSGGFSTPLSSHQSVGAIVSPGSKVKPLLPPEQRLNNSVLSNQQQKHGSVIVPNSQVNGHDPQHMLPNSKWNAPNAPVVSPGVQKSSCKPPTKYDRNSLSILPNSQRNGHDQQSVLSDRKQTTPNTVNLSPSLQRNSCLPSTNCQVSNPVILPNNQRSSTQFSGGGFGGGATNLTSSCQRSVPMHIVQGSNAAMASKTQRNSTVPPGSDPRNSTVHVSNCQKGGALKPSTHLQGSGQVMSSNTQKNSCKLPPHQKRNSPTLSSSRQGGSHRKSKPIPPPLPSSQSAAAVSPPEGKSTSTLMGVAHPKASTPLHNGPPPAAVDNGVLKHPPPSRVSSNDGLVLRGEGVLPQNTSLPAVISPTWDAASLSFLSDLFAPQPPMRQRHCSDSSLPTHPQVSLALPSMGGDQIISELLGNAQNQNALAVNPQSSEASPNNGRGGMMSELLHGSQNQCTSRCSLSRSSDVCGQTALNSDVQRSTATKTRPLMQPVSTPYTHTTIHGSLLSHQEDRPSSGGHPSFSIPNQTGSQNPQANTVRLSHQLQPATCHSPLSHDPRPPQQNQSSTSVNVWESTQRGSSQTLTSSVNPSQPPVQQLSASPQQGVATTMVPNLPKLTPFPNQPPKRGSYQSINTQHTPSSVSTPHCQLPGTGTLQFGSQLSGCVSTCAQQQYRQLPKSANSAVLTSSVVPECPLSVSTPHCQLPGTSTLQFASQLGGCVSQQRDRQLPKSASSAVLTSSVAPVCTSNPQSNTTQTQTSISLLNSILNSLSESELESLLSTNNKSVSQGNGRQGLLHSNVVVSQSQTALQNLNQNFGPPENVASSLSQLSHSTAAASSGTMPHPPRSKVTTQVDKASNHFRVRSSCATASGGGGGLSEQLFQLEPAAAGYGGVPGAMGMMDGNNSIMANAASVWRLHSGQ